MNPSQAAVDRFSTTLGRSPELVDQVLAESRQQATVSTVLLSAFSLIPFITLIADPKCMEAVERVFGPELFGGPTRWVAPLIVAVLSIPLPYFAFHLARVGAIHRHSCLPDATRSMFAFRHASVPAPIRRSSLVALIGVIYAVSIVGAWITYAAQVESSLS